MKGFIHVEINLGKNKSGAPDILADISDRLPIAGDSVDLVFSRATMEHLTYDELLNCLLETHRILKRGGCVRMVLPDFDKMIDQYSKKIYKPIKSPGFPNENYSDTFVARIMYFDHKYNHNFDTISRALEKCGFEGARLCQPGDSLIKEASPELKEAEAGRENDDMIVEAVKLDKKPSVGWQEKKWPGNSISRFLAKAFNLKISAFNERKPKFPSRLWLNELILKIKK